MKERNVYIVSVWSEGQKPSVQSFTEFDDTIIFVSDALNEMVTDEFRFKIEQWIQCCDEMEFVGYIGLFPEPSTEFNV